MKRIIDAECHLHKNSTSRSHNMICRSDSEQEIVQWIAKAKTLTDNQLSLIHILMKHQLHMLLSNE